jgi:hypothetical protein
LVAVSTKDATILTAQSTTSKTPRWIINLTHVHLEGNLDKHNLKIEKKCNAYMSQFWQYNN